ncbi:WD40-repeat-containing domain protein [Phascolomyces articulosus]|uniref:WD40-repeat-containing domain protein n=1 Tax=Phascolomyces articulosus TaxID=60185 RepID=A0AAD5KAI8_9FUNG|nr:WD40-repeat-containing domain protein [Phascolomyces articulosus]
MAFYKKNTLQQDQNQHQQTTFELLVPISNDGVYIHNNHKTHENVKTTIQNWQLRNLISCSDPRTIVHPYHESLYFYNIKTNSDSLVMDNLPYAPTALDSGYGYVALAGHRGMVMINSLSSDWNTTLKAGLGMNNCVRLSQHNSDLRVTICNNDQTISVYSIPSMQKLILIDMPAAINQVAVSPDGEKMLAVCDNGYAYIYQVSDYSRIKDLQEGAALLACAWKPTSDVFAVSTQDGLVHVYDAYTYQMVAQLGSIEPRKTRNAPRSIHFSKGPLDLLVYAEHVSNVNIVDTRTYETRQIIRLGPQDRDTHIAGLTFSPDNRTILVALETDLIQLPIDTIARRQFPSSKPLL